MGFSPGVEVTGSAELFSYSHDERDGERGVMMILVALAMVAIIAMAALSIDCHNSVSGERGSATLGRRGRL
jgi:hypothetical protein